MTVPNDDLAAKLRALEGKRKSLTKRIWPYVPLIDQKIQEGVRVEEILQLLSSELGTEVKAATLKTVRQRYHKAQTRAAAEQHEALPQEAIHQESPMPSLEQEGTSELSPSARKRKLEEILESRKRDDYGDECLPQRRPLVRRSQEP